MDDRTRRMRWLVAAAGVSLALWAVLIWGATQAFAQDAEVDDTSVAVEDDTDRGNAESNDDAVSRADDAGDAAAKDTPYEQWQYISIVLIPLAVQWLKRQEWTTGAKTALMVGISVVVALGGSWARGEMDNVAFTATAILQLVIGTQVAYTVLSQLPGAANLMDGLAKVSTPLPPRQSPP